MIGILGGTFDPVHFAHLRCGVELYQGLSLDELRFIPCYRPPHRDEPCASPEQRLEMLRIAVQDQPGFVVDERELRRGGASYMVDTLASLRDEHRDTPLCLLLGLDAFVYLNSWHRWEDLTGLAHLAVMERPGFTGKPAPEVAELLQRCLVRDPAALRDEKAGRIIRWPVTQLEISATRIREMLAAGRSPRYLLPDGVVEYIRNTNLYRD